MTTCGSCFRDEYGKIQECRKDALCRACLTKEVERLLTFARAVVAIMESNDPAITDTVWMPGPIAETLYDAALRAVDGESKHVEEQGELEMPKPAPQVLVSAQELSVLRECAETVLEYVPEGTWARNDTRMTRAAQAWAPVRLQMMARDGAKAGGAT